MTVFVYGRREDGENRFEGEISIVPLELLKPHENVDRWRLLRLVKAIGSRNLLKKPIVVDYTTNVVLDGHHRLQALKLLKCKLIPVVYVDYRDPRILVKTRRSWINLTKDSIIEAALTGRLFPPRTSMHMIVESRGPTHISSIEKNVYIRLDKLRKSRL